ncbi:Four-helix bundle copper-binding protein [Gammaproteobacteria bacterium]
MQDEITKLENTARRDLLKGMLAMTAAATVASKSVLGEELSEAAHEHAHHHHPMTEKNVGLIDAATHCVTTGEACVAHCLELIKVGDTSTAMCMESAIQMQTICTALSQLAAYRSAHLPALAKICATACEECEKECRKHEDKHPECKACANSCANCAKECKKIAA